MLKWKREGAIYSARVGSEVVAMASRTPGNSSFWTLTVYDGTPMKTRSGRDMSLDDFPTLKGLKIVYEMRRREFIANVDALNKDVLTQCRALAE